MSRARNLTILSLAALAIVTTLNLTSQKKNPLFKQFEDTLSTLEVGGSAIVLDKNGVNDFVVIRRAAPKGVKGEDSCYFGNVFVKEKGTGSIVTSYPVQKCPKEENALK